MGRLCRFGPSALVIGPGACCEGVGSGETGPGISARPGNVAGLDMSSSVAGPVDATRFGKVAKLSKTTRPEQVPVVIPSVVDGVWASTIGL